jgi:hypothetical protein
MSIEHNKVDVKFSVGGIECYIISLKLVQGFNCHHTFECVVDYEELDEKWMESPGTVFRLLGEDALISMQHRDGKGVNEFKGTVTHVSYIGHYGAQNHIRVSGCSPTIKLDGSRTMDSFTDMTLKGIVAEAVKNSGNGGSVTAQPKFTAKIDYIAQYDETCFEFLNRLSGIYAENFFYSGEEICFGKQKAKEEEITFESEMTSFDLTARLVPSKMRPYHYLVHEARETDGVSRPFPIDYLQMIAKEQSEKIYASEGTLPCEANVLCQEELENIAKANKYRAVAEMLVLSGASQTSKVKIGGEIRVKLPEYMKISEHGVGTFIVTSVTHEYDVKGAYRNTFSGVPDTIENIPVSSLRFPKAFPQPATVKSNDDEKKLGRVKVEFPWQKDKNKTTNWIRVATPDAGKSDKVPQNRGFVFIPEKDDLVMVDFEYGDPNRPFVSGSIFSERVSKGGSEDNHLRTITDKSRNYIQLNSQAGVKMVDKNNNFIDLSGTGDMKLFSYKSVEIICNNKCGIQLLESGLVKIKGSDIQIEAAERDEQKHVDLPIMPTIKELEMGCRIFPDPFDESMDTGRVTILSGHEIELKTRYLEMEGKEKSELKGGGTDNTIREEDGEIHIN